MADDLERLLADIDLATAPLDACATCGGDLGPLSPWWCSQSCERSWHAGRAKPLRGYREPRGGWSSDAYTTGLGSDEDEQSAVASGWRSPSELYVVGERALASGDTLTFSAGAVELSFDPPIVHRGQTIWDSARTVSGGSYARTSITFAADAEPQEPEQ